MSSMLSKWAGGILALAALLAYPFLDRALGWNAIGDVSQVLIYVILAVGLNIVVGFAGLFHLGYAAFFAVGAFSMAYLTSPQSPLPEGMIVGFWPGLIGACVVTALFGAVLSWPTLGLRGDYLAIVTMGFGLMLDPILRNYDDTTKAVTGLSAVASPVFFGRVLGTEDRVGWFYVLAAGVVASIWLARQLRDSRVGRSLKALREDEIAASACGIDLPGVKLVAFTTGSLVAGLAGALYASFIYTLNLAFPLDFNGSVMILAMVILGGVGSIRGAVLGALALGLVNLVVTPRSITAVNTYVLPQLTKALEGSASPETIQWLQQVLDLSKAQFMLFGLALVLMMLLRPEGILPEKPGHYDPPAEAR